MILFIIGVMFLALAGIFYRELKRKEIFEREYEKKYGCCFTIWEQGGPEALTANSEKIIFPTSLIIAIVCILGGVIKIIFF